MVLPVRLADGCPPTNPNSPAMEVVPSACPPSLQTLPSDALRAAQWRFADRYDLAMLVQSARSVARGPVARLVANGARNTHEWTADKASLLAVFDESGITAAFLDPEHGGFIEGPKNLALALIAFELAWVDAGAATSSLAGNLGLAPIHECGTKAQRDHYMALAAPNPENSGRPGMRAAFALTEPIPFVGVETGLLDGKVGVASWNDGDEPMLRIEKRGRFITGMAFATVVTAAVASDDPRLKGSCMVILEKNDPGAWDIGVPTRKLVHQLSSTRDPVFSLTVPASRIIGGYTVKDGVIVPNLSHGEVIEAVFRRTRVTVGLMTSAKLLSVVEPVIRYQRSRFRGGQAEPGTPRYDVGLQSKQDALQRLVDVWAAGEASAALGFEAARLFDQVDPMEKEKNRLLAERRLTGRAAFKALAKIQQDAIAYLEMARQPESGRDAARFAELGDDPLVRFVILDAQADVLCPACKLWNTGHGTNMMREAVSLMGGYGVTEDCPGFLFQKWMDAQLEATYEGPEAVQRRQMSVTMVNELFLAQFGHWTEDLAAFGAAAPGSGARPLAVAMELWLWTLRYLQRATDALGQKLYSGNRQGVNFPLADALCWLLASRQQILDVRNLAADGPSQPALADELPGALAFLTDLSQVQAARAAAEVARICAELAFGYNAPVTDPAATAAPVEIEFAQLHRRLVDSLKGSRLAKDRAAEALVKVMIPEALDYPV